MICVHIFTHNHNAANFLNFVSNPSCTNLFDLFLHTKSVIYFVLHINMNYFDATIVRMFFAIASIHKL